MVGTLIGHLGLLVLVHVEAHQWPLDIAMILCQRMADVIAHRLVLHEEQGNVMRAIALVRIHMLMHIHNVYVVKGIHFRPSLKNPRFSY